MRHNILAPGRNFIPDDNDIRLLPGLRFRQHPVHIPLLYQRKVVHVEKGVEHGKEFFFVDLTAGMEVDFAYYAVVQYVIYVEDFA